MYCVKCGVELADSEKKCPLCGTPVYFPEKIVTAETKRSYPPEEKPEEINRSIMPFLLTFIFVIPLILTFVCDISLNEKMTWSVYAVSSIILAYVIIVMPIWFATPNAFICVSVDFISMALFLWVINYYVGGAWFFKLALPVVGSIALLTLSVMTLLKYFRKKYLYIYGGALIASGILTMLLEYLINSVFYEGRKFVWSYYPLVVLSLLGIMLIVIASSKTLRESFKKKFFIG